MLVTQGFDNGWRMVNEIELTYDGFIGTSRSLAQERVFLGGPVLNITSGSHHSCGVLVNGEARWDWSHQLVDSCESWAVWDPTDFLILDIVFLLFSCVFLIVIEFVNMSRFTTGCVHVSVLALQHVARCAAQVKCWGCNSRGQLGTGDVQNRGDEPNEMGDFLRAAPWRRKWRKHERKQLEIWKKCWKSHEISNF